MRATWIDLTWTADTAPGIPAKYRRACRYTAYVPDRLADLALDVPLDLAGLVAEAETNIRALNRDARPALIPLARFLLKAESIASSNAHERAAALLRQLAEGSEPWAIPWPFVYEFFSVFAGLATGDPFA